MPQTIELQANVIRAANGPCSNYKTDIVQDLPAMRLEPDDDQIEVVVFADGAERNRLIVEVKNLEPDAANYTLQNTTASTTAYNPPSDPGSAGTGSEARSTLPSTR